MNPFIPVTYTCVQSQRLDMPAVPEEFARAVAKRNPAPPFTILLTGNGSPDAKSYAALSPLLVLKAKNGIVSLTTCEGTIEIQSGALSFFQGLMDGMRERSSAGEHPGAAFGYFAYELKNEIERLPQTAADDLHLPDLFMLWPSELLVCDHVQGSVIRYVFAATLEGRPLAPVVLSEPPVESAISDEARSNFTREEYLKAVNRIRRHIRDGDVYQINLTQRFSLPRPPDPFDLWLKLFRNNPAPYYASIHAGDHLILSTSMERFLSVRGTDIASQPIKGTRKRGSSEAEDAALKRDLLADPKDEAELSMIVDLVRNDLSRVCEAGTVEVAEHKRIDAYTNVFHLSSIVSGTLRPHTTMEDIIRAAFPPGSVTGCPKIRAMQIIDAIEPQVRHVYTGSIGFVGLGGTMELSVAIRTAIITPSACYFAVGGGVVFDSEPEAEYAETLHKAASFFQALEIDVHTIMARNSDVR